MALSARFTAPPRATTGSPSLFAVAIQEEKKYQRLSGVEFGPMDFKAYAESFGAKGFAVESAEALEPTLHAAMDVDGPAVVAIPVDYRDNPLLMGQLHLSQIL